VVREPVPLRELAVDREPVAERDPFPARELVAERESVAEREPLALRVFEAALLADRVFGAPALAPRGPAARPLPEAMSSSISPLHPRLSRTRKGPCRPPRHGPLQQLSRRRPTLPGSCPPSTIGAGGLNFRVRDGNGCGPTAMVTGNLCSIFKRPSRATFP
jgi:hypothetical protein